VENDSTSTISPGWPTHWPPASFKSPWAWIVAILIVAFFTAVMILTLRMNARPGGASMTSLRPSALEIDVAIQAIVEGLVVAAIIAALPKLSGISLRDLGFRVPSLQVVGIAVAGAVAMVIVCNGSVALIDAAMHSQHQQDVVATFKGLHDAPTIALLTFFAVVLAPFCEETLFRIFLFNFGMRYGGFWTGAILSGVVFGVAHADAYAALPLALGGVILCYVYYRSRNAFASTISHALFNALSVFVLLFFPNLSS
jgi:membrane protease YdiL (CAAX protease family)